MKDNIFTWLTILDVVCFCVSMMTGWETGIGGSVVVFVVLIVSGGGHSSDKKQTQEMSGLEYEHWCAKSMMESGKFRKVTVTPPTRDFGADIVAIDKAKKKWVFQCKHYKSKLGNTPIQEVVTAKAHYKADYAAVVTNSTFTTSAKQLARENGVKLYEGVKENSPVKKHKNQWRNYSVEEMIFYDDIFE